MPAVMTHQPCMDDGPTLYTVADEPIEQHWRLPSHMQSLMSKHNSIGAFSRTMDATVSRPEYQIPSTLCKYCESPLLYQVHRMSNVLHAPVESSDCMNWGTLNFIAAPVVLNTLLVEGLKLKLNLLSHRWHCSRLMKMHRVANIEHAEQTGPLKYRQATLLGSTVWWHCTSSTKPLAMRNMPYCCMRAMHLDSKLKAVLPTKPRH